MKSNIWKIAVSDVFYRFGFIGSLYIIYFNYLGYDSLYIGIYEAIALLILITVQEPMRHNKEIISFWYNMQLGVKYIFRLKSLLWLVVFALFVDVFAEGYWDTFSQTHLQNFVGEFYAMLIFACIGGVSAVASYFIDKIEKSIGKKWILYIVVGGQAILFMGLALAAHWYVLTIILVFFNINRNITWLLTDNYQNKLIPSEHRASILSVSSFLRNGLFGGAIILILLGWAFNQFEMDVSVLFFIIAGLVLLINGSLLITRDFREKRGKISDLSE